MITLVLSHLYSNFFAAMLPVLLFLYWGVIGYACLALLYSQRNHLQNLLLAPIIGLSLLVVLIFLPNWFGLPIKNYGTLLTLGLLMLSVIILIYKKPILPLKRYLPFAGCLLLSMIFMVIPLLKYGFNWISFGNDDMVNYALGAIRFLTQGYNVTPNFEDFINGRDYSVYYWFMHVAGMERGGSELVLAWLASVTHLSTLQLFMPLIIGINLTLISACGALIYQSKFWRPVAIATCFLLALSGLQALGVLYQLIAQVFGISLLLATITILFKTYRFKNYNQVSRNALLLSILLAAVTISYPEVSPFLIISFSIFLIYNLYRKVLLNRYYGLWLLLTAIFTLMIINTYAVNYFIFLLQQVTGSGLTKSASSIFPYLLVPTGFANLWSILPISSHINEPWLSFGILVGDLITIVTVACAIYQIKRKFLPTAIVCFVMTAMGVMWFINNQGFVLFKLAMYVQPFIISTFVVACYMLFAKKFLWKIPVWLIPIGLLAIFFVNTQAYYLERSYGSPGNFVEFPNASKQRIVSQYIQDLSQTSDKNKIILMTSNMVEEKLASLLTYNHPAFVTSRHVFPNMMRAFWVPGPLKKMARPALWEQAENLCSAVEKHYEVISFNLHNDKKQAQYDEMWVPKNNPVSDANIYVLDLPAMSPFNHWQLTDEKYKGVAFLTKENAKNLLTFMHSKYSQNYYLGENEFITLYGTQKDYFYPGHAFVGVGQSLMFQLLNPAPQARIVLTYSSTLNPDRATKLPQVDIVGASRQAFPVTGYGSARITVPVSPQWIKGIPYVRIDIKSQGQYYKIPRYGLMKLYGEGVTLDYRRLAAYLRDVSLVSEQEYINRDAPSAINQFPEDLANKNLEYSGIYEEGWVGNELYVKLKQPKHHNLLVIKGLYPLIEDNKKHVTQVKVEVDGKSVANSSLTPQEFQFNILLPDEPGIKHIVLKFSDLFPLPGGDRRVVSARLKSISFQELFQHTS